VTTKSAFPALGKPLSLAIVHGTFHIKGLALPKFVERGNFSLNYLVIRLLSLKMDHQTEAGQPKCRPTNVRGQSMVWAIAILCLVLYTPLAEYAAHRWLMHFPGMGRGSWWREHAIEHHGKGRNDVNIDINALSVVAATSPMFVFAIFLGWAWVAFVLFACIGYAALWSSLHESYHGISENWVTKFRFYDIWLEHHLKHHQRPTRNFGTVFIFTDRLFGTHV
jgi:sterol desaturase/sphingolipid hydroxylase (fatty acid hydroxylase superfamily)